MLVAALWLTFALGGCQGASTLGGKAADHVGVTDATIWAAGVDSLMGVKCAVCHQVPRPDIAPATTPSDLDLRQPSASGVVRGAQDIAAALLGPTSTHVGVLRGTVYYIQPMPPAYATPLYADEMTALETWAAAVPPPASAGAPLYARHCQGCHGVTGTGGPYLSLRGIAGGAAGGALISGAIANSNIPQMFYWPKLSTLTATDCATIASYLSQL